MVVKPRNTKLLKHLEEIVNDNKKRFINSQNETFQGVSIV